MPQRKRATEPKKKISNRTSILMRYGMISSVLIIIAVLIVVQLVKTTVIKADEWNRAADAILSQMKVIAPERGNILADNGNILACNLTMYDISVDLRHQKIQQLGKQLPWASIDSLADSLDVYYPLADLGGKIPDFDSPDSWHKKFKDEFGKAPDKRPRALRVLKKGTLTDFNRIKSFPFFNTFSGKGTANPVYTEARTERIYPFGKMAHRSIGRVREFENEEIHGYSGLELDLDTLLYGKEGYAKKVMMTNGVDHVVDQPAVKGYTVHTTINIDMQDMVEEELTKVCEEAKAYWGTAILMEVETGEIKAIANVQRLDDGTYGEGLNRAVRRFEPGSVMKPISMMIAFEDGLVKNLSDEVDTSPFQRTTDHGGPKMKNMKQVIGASSNTGISRIIFRGYADNPPAFHERLNSIGFFSPMHTGIAGTNVPNFPSLEAKDKKGRKVTMTARHLALARQSFGYSMEIPPIYIVAYYNAIANGGVMIEPHIVKKLIGEQGDSVTNIASISRRVCSEETAAKMRECMLAPVWDAGGTAKAVRDDNVKIAGKTGTAFPIPDDGGTYDKTKRRLAFAGYFPADNPKYTCMVLMLTDQGQSAPKTSGQVLKNIALKLFSRGMLDNVSTFTEKRSDTKPVIAATDSEKLAKVKKNIGASESQVMKFNRTFTPEGTVPDVTGYDLDAAVKTLESKGYAVTVEGIGFVSSQNPLPGVSRDKGTNVHLKLSL